MTKADLLKLRAGMRKRKPVFIRQDAHKKTKLAKRWKKPRGLQSKLRLNMKGAGQKVRIGYRFPSAVRGLSREGLQPKLVYKVEDLIGLNTKKQGAIISKSIGNKKRVAIIKEAVKSNIKILNIKNADGYIKKIENKMKEKKEEKIGKLKVKEKKGEEKVVEKKEKKLSDEEKKKKDKEEKDKILTKKG